MRQRIAGLVMAALVLSLGGFVFLTSMVVSATPVKSPPAATKQAPTATAPTDPTDPTACLAGGGPMGPPIYRANQRGKEGPNAAGRGVDLSPTHPEEGVRTFWVWLCEDPILAVVTAAWFDPNQSPYGVISPARHAKALDLLRKLGDWRHPSVVRRAIPPGWWTNYMVPGTHRNTPPRPGYAPYPHPGESDFLVIPLKRGGSRIFRGKCGMQGTRPGADLPHAVKHNRS
ncbi:MAG: hypothetical protein JWN01_564 [Patescibacteria group bacterium]|nr:hypothetical protein [Patescibacteria group bacterium]